MKIVTLTTDFGIEDSYVGAMKGVILSSDASAQIVDFTHEILPQDVLHGSLVIQEAYLYYPKGTIHLGVVDPGVGSSRLPIVVESKGHYFVGPDNGLFGFTMNDRMAHYWKIEKSRVNQSASATFEGRDIFARVAGFLLEEKPITSYCKSIQKIENLTLPEPKSSKKGILGEVVNIDHFGNLISNIEKQANLEGDVFCKGKKIGSIGKTYSDAKEGKFLAIWNSSRRLEISVRNGSAENKLKAKRGDRVEVRFT